METAKTIAPLALAIIMFGLGLGLTTSDFLRVIKTPRDFIVGFLSQVILLPIIAFGLILIIPMSIEIAMGVMIIAAAPGGVTSNVLTKFANGDVALSVSLTAVVSLLAIFIVPLIIFNSANFIGVEITQEISMLNIAIKMFLVVTVPVLLGMIVRSLMTDFIISKTLIIQRLSVILFLIVFISIWVEEWDRIVSFIARAGLVAGILNLDLAHLEIAVAFLKQVVEVQPHNKEAHFKLALAYRQLDQDEQAKEHLSQSQYLTDQAITLLEVIESLEQNPGNEDLRNQAIELYDSLGKKEEAERLRRIR